MQIKSARIPFLFLRNTPGILPEKIGEFLSGKKRTLRYSLRIPFSFLWQQGCLRYIKSFRIDKTKRILSLISVYGIYNGGPATTATYPFVVFLRMFTGTTETGRCSGYLYALNLVVTSGNVVENNLNFLYLAKY
jgi:hypothetical protein